MYLAMPSKHLVFINFWHLIPLPHAKLQPCHLLDTQCWNIIHAAGGNNIINELKAELISDLNSV